MHYSRVRIWLEAGANASLAIALIVGFCAQVVSAQECAEIPADVVSWWTGDNTADDMTGSNHGTLQNGITYSTGQVVSGFDLDGVDDHVLVPDDESLNLTTLSIEAWIKTSQIGATLSGFVLAKSGADGLGGYELGVASEDDGRIRFTLNGGESGSDFFGISNLIDGQWHHIAGTYDGEFMKIYVDGRLEAVRSTSVIPSHDEDSHLLIGYRQFSGGSGPFGGLIDEVTLYSRALCRTEVKVIYEAGVEGKCLGGVVAECPFFEDSFGY